jgi:hypothetical protein
VSGAPEEPRIACTWCGLFSSPGFCDSCGSPLTTEGFSVEASDQASVPPPVAALSGADAAASFPTRNGPLIESVPVLTVAPTEEGPNPAEILALVEDPTPLVDGPTEPELPEPMESLESPRVEALALESESASISTQPLDSVDQKPDLQSDEGPETASSQGPRCSSCGRAGVGGLCETCREAMRELSALSR